MKSTVERLKDIVNVELGVKKELIVPKSDIRFELGADELDFVTLIMAVEEEFGLAIQDKDAESIVTFGDLVDYVENHT